MGTLFSSRTTHKLFDSIELGFTVLLTIALIALVVMCAWIAPVFMAFLASLIVAPIVVGTIAYRVRNGEWWWTGNLDN